MTLLKKFICTAALATLSLSAHAIPASYGTATHSTPNWQTLEDPLNGDDFGVSWSVDGGTTWGREDLFVGQSVQFRFNMHKRNVGTHYADLLGAWFDWGQDGVFDHDADQIVYHEHVLATSKGVVNTEHEQALGSYRTPDTPNIEVFSASFDLTADHVGENWLRAQVTCTHSVTKKDGISNHWDAQWDSYYIRNYQNLFQPTGHYYQGETEEWMITVSHVSEPGSIALLGLGLLGLAAARRRT